MDTVGRGRQGFGSHAIKDGGTRNQLLQGTNPASGNDNVHGPRPPTSLVTYDPSADLLHTLEKSVEDLRSLVSCRVCVRPMYEPYTIACGHTFCYSCLAQWFSSHNSNKTCPDCRAKVVQQPAPAYVVREMAQLFTGRAELMAFGESTEGHKKCQEEEATMVERDKANLDEETGGLFRGCFKARLHGARQTIRDDEDGVTRCPNCTWELEDGYCNACGVGYGSDGEEFSGEDLSFSEDDESDTGHLSFSDNHSGHPITDEDADYAALVEMGWNEDISLDEDGQSVHTDHEHTLGEFTFGRGAAQGLLGQPIRRNGSSNVVGRRQYAPSTLSDVATTYDDNDHEDEAQSSNDTSDDDDDDDDGDSSEEDDGSLQDFVADDGESEEDATEDQSMYNFSPLLGGSGAGYTGQSRHDPHTLIDEEDGDGSPGRNFYAESDSDGIITTTSPRQRGPTWGTSQSNLLGRRQVLPAPEVNSAQTSNPPIHNRQPGVGRASSERRVNTNPIPVQSESESSDSPMPPPRSRKRRLVVDLSDDGSDSDVDTYRPRKRKSSSSGSVTLGRQSPVPATIESPTRRMSQSYQPPIQTPSTMRDVADASRTLNQPSNHLSLRNRLCSPPSRWTWPTSSTLRAPQPRETQAMPRIEHYSNTSRRMRHDTKTEWRRRNLDRDPIARADS